VGEIIFESACTFALGGADFAPNLDGIPIPTWTTHFAQEGSVLNFAKRKTGQRAYFTVSGGLDVPVRLGSKSTNLAAGLGGFCGRMLLPGDRIELKSPERSSTPPRLALGYSMAGSQCSDRTIRITAGPEFSLLTPLSVEKLFSEEFRISNDSNRMGYRLQGEPLFLLQDLEMVSAGVDFGTIQLLPNGQLVVLMADHQTTGGYPRIGQIIRRDLASLGQLGAHDKISLESVTIAEAEGESRKLDAQLALLRAGRKFRIGE
jgi:antagonist of KipI